MFVWAASEADTSLNTPLSFTEIQLTQAISNFSH